MARRPTDTFSFQVHEGGDGTLDGLLRLIGIGERESQLEDVLTAMCADVAAIAAADVASVYVHEEGPEGPRFTMRGNVGFPPEAVGRVHLRPGEGITGFAADRLRPVSVEVGDRDERFKYISGLGEERFPALLAVPVLRGGAAVGVLVLQRSKPRVFSDGEVVLATALAAVINHAIERGLERERRQASRVERRAVRLGGNGISGGAALGQAEVLPTLSALAREAPVTTAGDAAPAARIGDLFKRVETQLRRAMIGAEGSAESEMVNLALILQDERFRGRLATACASEAPLRALSELARAYARVPFAASSRLGRSSSARPSESREVRNPSEGSESARLGRSSSARPSESREVRNPSEGSESAENADTTSWLGDRAAEIEDLCVLAFAAAGTRPLVRGGTIVVAERLGLFSTLHAIAAGASGFVVDGAVSAGSAAVAAVHAAGRPLLTNVSGVFSWLRPDDLLVVDADAGVLRINPSATTVARYRSAQR